MSSVVNAAVATCMQKRKAAQAVKDSDGKVVSPAGKKQKPSAKSRADAAVKNDRKVTPAAGSTKHRSHAATTKDANAPGRQPAKQQNGRTSEKPAHKRTRAAKGPLESSKISEKPSPSEGGKLGGPTIGMKPAVSRTCAPGHNLPRPSVHLASWNVPSATHRRGTPAPLLAQVRIAGGAAVTCHPYDRLRDNCSLLPGAQELAKYTDHFLIKVTTMRERSVQKSFCTDNAVSMESFGRFNGA